MISIALCTYNGAKYINQQIESIINQTVQPDEIIICDDCSTDDTINVLKRTLSNWHGDYKIIDNEHNLGFRKNFEKAIRLCRGDIIFLSDQDDVWEPHKIEILSKVLNENPNVNLTFHDAKIVDEKLNLISNSFWKILNFDYNRFNQKKSAHLQHANVVQGSACAFKKKILLDAVPFPLEAYHDEWLALIALMTGDIVAVPLQLLLYRQSGNNAVGANSETACGKIKKWIAHVHDLSLEHYDAITRREKLLCEYENRFLKKLNQNSPYYEYYKFLVTRKDHLGQGDWKILLRLLNYISVSDNIMIALKIWVKDLLYLLNRRKIE